MSCSAQVTLAKRVRIWTIPVFLWYIHRKFKRTHESNTISGSQCSKHNSQVSKDIRVPGLYIHTEILNIWIHGVFAYIYLKNYPNVGKYTIHWAFGILSIWDTWGLVFGILFLAVPLPEIKHWKVSTLKIPLGHEKKQQQKTAYLPLKPDCLIWILIILIERTYISHIVYWKDLYIPYSLF